jgi:NhaP-type Na+/H+ or K+/H+ antiporter
MPSFFAGVALRRSEFAATGEETPNEALEEVSRGDRKEASTDPKLAHAYLAESMMAFSVELERLVELALMLIVGSTVSTYWREMMHWQSACVVVALFVLVRPISVAVSLAGSSLDWRQRSLTGWLGIRGVGSFYYLLLAIENGPTELMRPLIPLVLSTIVASVFLHGITASPLLKRYLSRTESE